MNWFKKAYQDSGTKWLTVFLMAGGPVFSIASRLVSPSPGWWQAWAFCWGFYPFFVLMLYLHRNAK